MSYKENQIKWFIFTAMSYINTPYRYGGDDFSSIDCSGLVMECLKSIGMKRTKEDRTAAGLLDDYRDKETPCPSRGSLAFWADLNGNIIHVAICVDPHFCITADGGGKSTQDLTDAIEQNAWVKIRPILYRKRPPVKYIDLF